jgi:prepilin-type N-terminal cleavage/methylation domain-containing protein
VHCAIHEGDRRSDRGFTLTELLFVVLIIGILIVVAVPMLVTATAHAQRKTCFANQRTIEGVISVWQMEPDHNDLSTLAGVVSAAHPLIAGNFIVHPPRCPNGPSPAVPTNPTAAEGAYTLDATGTVEPCVFGAFGPHGSFDNH